MVIFSSWSNESEQKAFGVKHFYVNMTVNMTVNNHEVSTALQASLRHHDRQNSFKILHLLLENGGIINTPISGYSGSRELISAASTGSIAIVQQLLDLGAEVNSSAENYGITALQQAVSLTYPSIEIVKLLLK